MLFFSVTGNILFAQSDKEVIIQADKYFRQENYSAAMLLYSQLLSLHRNDPLYSYRFGVSMLYSDRREPNLAIKYIESGLDKLQGEDAVMIYFHLATAYHLTFRFAEAMNYYNMFAETAPEKLFVKFDVEQRLDMCNNGARLLQNIRDLYVFEKHHVYTENFFRSYNAGRFGGQLLVKPDLFKTKFDRKTGESSIVFLSDTQQVVYYSSYGKDGANGKDIYRSFKKADGSWNTPECLSNIVNTKYDEDYPFILPDGNTLYFCSKGHNSMGGYDVFRTTWDEDESEWTIPVNLDFAINTPYDDILFITDRDEKFAYFSSVRNSGLKQINVYLVRIDVRPENTSDDLIAEVSDLSADVSDSAYKSAVRLVQDISNLDVNARKEDFDKTETSTIKPLFADNYKYNISENPTDDELIELTFSHARNAELSLQSLQQKRHSVDRITDNYRQLSGTYEKETDKLRRLASEQQDAETAEYYKQQAAIMKQKADDAGSLYNKSVELARSLDTAIVKQRKEYDRIIMKAGDIQRLASARQIDTSVVLLKKLIDEIRVFEISVKEQIVHNLPAPEDLVYYDARISDKKIEIQQLNDEQKSLQSEKEQLQKGLNQANDPVVRESLNNEIRLIDKEITEIQNRKNILYNDLTTLNSDKTSSEQFIQSPAYTVIREINTVNKLAAQSPDSVNRYYALNEEKLNNEIAKIYNEPVKTAEVISEKNDSADANNLNNRTENDQITQNDTVYVSSVTNPVTSSETTVNNNDIAFTRDSVPGNEIVKTDESENFLTDSKTDVKSDEKTQPVVTVLSSEEKTEYFEEIVSGNLPVDEKARQVVTMTEQQLDIAKISKEVIESEAADLYENIINIQTEMQSVSEKLEEENLNAWERRTLIRSYDDLSEKYNNDLMQLEHLIVMLEHTDERIETLQDISKEITGQMKKVEKMVISGNESKAEVAFENYSESFPAKTEILFEDAASVRFSVKKHAEALRIKAEELDKLVAEAESRSEDYVKKSQKFEEKAESASDEETRNKFLDQREETEQLALEFADSADLYRIQAQTLRQFADQIAMDQVIVAEKFEQQLALSETMQREPDTNGNNPISSESTVLKQQVAELFEYTGRNILKSEDLFSNKNEIITETWIPQQLVLPPDNEENNLISEKIRQTSDPAGLRAIADKEQVYILRASATLLVTKIKQLEDEIRYSTDPVEIATLAAEKTQLQEELAIVVKQHDRIAAEYQDIDVLDSRLLPEYSEMRNDPDNALQAIEKHSVILNDQISELRNRAETTASQAEKQRIENRIVQLENEVAVYTLKAIEIVARADRNKVIAASVVTRSLPLAGADRLTLEKIQRIEEEQMILSEKLVSEMLKAEKISSIEQKRIVYISLYDDIFKDLQLQQEKYDLYRQYMASGTDINDIAEKNVSAAISDKNIADAYLAHKPASEVLAEAEAGDITNKIPATADIISEVRKESNEITDRSDNEILVDVVTENNVDNNTEIANPLNNLELTETSEVVANNSVIVTEKQSDEYVPFYSATNPIPEHVAPEGKLLFRVQFAASRRPAADDTYAGMSPLFYELADGWYRYMHGEFYQPEPAVNARNQVRTLGFADAFVVAYYNGKRITMAEARNIYATQQGAAGTEIAEATIPGITAVTAGNIVPFSDVSGFYYAVQIGVYGSPRTSERLFGITPLIEDRMANGNYRYLTRTYVSLEEANAARDRIRTAGVPDAFVVVYRNGVRISAAEARDFIAAGEKTNASQAGTQPGIDVNVSEERAKRAANIYFKVQLGAFRNQVPVEVVNTFISVAGEGIQILTDAQGLTIYLAGKFKTPAEAEALRNKVQAEGIPDAFIVAVEGDKKISMQEARELLGIK